jgi:hypothetical protein
MVSTVTDRDPVSGFIAIPLHAVEKDTVFPQLKENDRVGADPEYRPETVVSDKGHSTGGVPGPGQPQKPRGEERDCQKKEQEQKKPGPGKDHRTFFLKYT